MITAKKNIVYIVNSLNLGGTETLVVQMSQTFRSTYNISVICLDEPGIWAKKLRNQGIPVYCFWRQPGLDLAMAKRIASFCRNNGVDLIHAHQCTPWFYSALSRCFYFHPKVLFEEHGRFYPEQYSWKKNCVNKVCIQNLTHKVVAVSKDVQARLVKYEGISEKRIEVVYNGVHSPHLITGEQREQIRSQFGLSHDDFLIGAIGRLDPIKNLPLLLRSVAELRGKVDNIKILLVGDGPDLQMLRELSRSLNLDKNVVFAGYRNDATDILQCLDLFVLCSFSEGTSMALLEAMAAGIPAIVSDVGGNPELIENGQNGWVVPSDSMEGLSGAILQACSSPDIRHKVMKNGKNKFNAQFSFAKMIQKYEAIYSSMLQAAH